MKRLVLAVVLGLALILPGLALTPTKVSLGPEEASAHAADCSVYFHYSPSVIKMSGVPYTRADVNCSHKSWYKATIYICGGVNGSGYCLAPSSLSCYNFAYYPTGCSGLYGISTSCGNIYAGPYWYYGGVKIESKNAQGQSTGSKWVFGSGQWLSGGC